MSRSNVSKALIRQSQRGFTLVEIIVAMTITSIIIGFVSMFMTAPVDAYMDQSERALLNDSSQRISRSMAEDLRSALPNSVRFSNVGSRAIVELLAVSSVSFYRSAGTFPPLLPNPDRELDFAGADTRFSLFGTLTAGSYLVVGNLGMGPRTDAYGLANSEVIAPLGSMGVVTDAVTKEQTVTINSPFRFKSPDVRNRLFVVTGPITYICNSAANARTLRRYQGYPLTQAIPTTETSPQLTAAVEQITLATDVASCRLSCRGVAAAFEPVCKDALAVEITIERTTQAAPEVLRLFEQFPVDNK